MLLLFPKNVIIFPKKSAEMTDIRFVSTKQAAEILGLSPRRIVGLCNQQSFDGAAEGFYHGMMLGLAAGMSSRYYIRSNRESGEGRFDLVLEPKLRTLPGIIMEFKAVKEEGRLSAGAEEALRQIELKHYDTDLRDRGIKDIVKYGISFFGKKVEIATNVIPGSLLLKSECHKTRYGEKEK